MKKCLLLLTVFYAVTAFPWKQDSVETSTDSELNDSDDCENQLKEYRECKHDFQVKFSESFSNPDFWNDVNEVEKMWMQVRSSCDKTKTSCETLLAERAVYRHIAELILAKYSILLDYDSSNYPPSNDEILEKLIEANDNLLERIEDESLFDIDSDASTSDPLEEATTVETEETEESTNIPEDYYDLGDLFPRTSEDEETTPSTDIEEESTDIPEDSEDDDEPKKTIFNVSDEQIFPEANQFVENSSEDESTQEEVKIDHQDSINNEAAKKILHDDDSISVGQDVYIPNEELRDEPETIGKPEIIDEKPRAEVEVSKESSGSPPQDQIQETPRKPDASFDFFFNGDNRSSFSFVTVLTVVFSLFFF